MGGSQDRPLAAAFTRSGSGTIAPLRAACGTGGYPPASIASTFFVICSAVCRHSRVGLNSTDSQSSRTS